MRYTFLIVLGFHFFQAASQKITITAAGYDLETPVEIQLKKPLASNSAYSLKDRSGKIIPAQLRDSLTLVFIPPVPIKAGKIETYQLLGSTKSAAKLPVSLNRKPNGILVEINKRPLFFYHIKAAMPPADSPSYYQRSGFIHPLYSPAGQVMTDDFPVAHIHQHAIFSAWTNTTFRSTPVDFWNQHNKTGTVEHVNVLTVKEGPVFAEIETELAYKSSMHGNVISERWRLLVYPFEKYFLFDLELFQRNITSDTLFLNPYHYGGMAFRGSREWNADDKIHFTGNWKILTSEGIRDSAANQTAARWVNASGKVDGKWAGVSVFNHSSNFRYPQKIRVHPQMPYWCYAPMIDGAFYIAPGNIYRAKFRYYVHNNAVSSEAMESVHKQWVDAPSISVE